LNLKHIVDKEDNNSLSSGNSVAIVGSGPSLTRVLRGREIDKHESIIRFNDAPTGLPTTGEKTTIRLVNDSNYDKYVGSSFENIVCFGKHAYHPPRRKVWRNFENVFSLDHEKGDSRWANKVIKNIGLSYQFSEEVLKVIHKEEWPPSGIEYRVHPRIGLRAILICVDSGLKPDVYGFDNVLGSKYQHFWGAGHSHGFGWEQINEMGHEVETEMLLIRELIEKELVNWKS
tara:strand:+ start:2960 stop:3649 length:690 start_codon:yes stop_codon:yes gene_type:complete